MSRDRTSDLPIFRRASNRYLQSNALPTTPSPHWIIDRVKAFIHSPYLFTRCRRPKIPKMKKFIGCLIWLELDHSPDSQNTSRLTQNAFDDHLLRRLRARKRLKRPLLKIESAADFGYRYPAYARCASDDFMNMHRLPSSLIKLYRTMAREQWKQQ